MVEWWKQPRATVVDRGSTWWKRYCLVEKEGQRSLWNQLRHSFQHHTWTFVAKFDNDIQWKLHDGLDWLLQGHRLHFRYLPELVPGWRRSVQIYSSQSHHEARHGVSDEDHIWKLRQILDNDWLDETASCLPLHSSIHRIRSPWMPVRRTLHKRLHVCRVSRWQEHLPGANRKREGTRVRRLSHLRHMLRREHLPSERLRQDVPPQPNQSARIVLVREVLQRKSLPRGHRGEQVQELWWRLRRRDVLAMQRRVLEKLRCLRVLSLSDAGV